MLLKNIFETWNKNLKTVKKFDKNLKPKQQLEIPRKRMQERQGKSNTSEFFFQNMKKNKCDTLFLVVNLTKAGAN